MKNYKIASINPHDIFSLLSQTKAEDQWSCNLGLVYSAKVLSEQLELLQIFREHEIFRKKIKNAFRSGYHSSIKITKFYSHKMSSDNLILYRFGGTHSKCSPSKVSAFDYQCIGFSKSLRFPLIRNRERALVFLNVWSVRLEICKYCFPEMVMSFASH